MTFRLKKNKLRFCSRNFFKKNEGLEDADEKTGMDSMIAKMRSDEFTATKQGGYPILPWFFEEEELKGEGGSRTTNNRNGRCDTRGRNLYPCCCGSYCRRCRSRYCRYRRRRLCCVSAADLLIC